MKKFLFILLIPMLFIDGCFFGTREEAVEYVGTQQLRGEYTHEQYNNTYNVIVDLIVEDSIVTSITIDDASYNYTQDEEVWKKEEWLDVKQDFLDVLIGKSVSELNAINVSTDQDGAPHDGTLGEFENDLVAGATQSAGRIILAIQDALRELDS